MLLLKEQISEVLTTLAPREAEVLRLRFGLVEDAPAPSRRLDRTLA